ncbi:hypothetical protein [Xanthomonas campestris]|uniref:hypothetical protein n=1 Tax=Xanthomonas campestris TaxID=339 RepID=UPI0039C3043C
MLSQRGILSVRLSVRLRRGLLTLGLLLIESLSVLLLIMCLLSLSFLDLNLPGFLSLAVSLLPLLVVLGLAFLRLSLLYSTSPQF